MNLLCDREFMFCVGLLIGAFLVNFLAGIGGWL